MDKHLQDFILSLISIDDLKDSVIIIYGDHTTGLHASSYSARRFSYGENVPLIIFDPTRHTPIKITEAASHLDIAPTITDLANIPPDKRWPGRSVLKWYPDRLRPVICDQEPMVASPLYNERVANIIDSRYQELLNYSRSYFYHTKYDNHTNNFPDFTYIAHALGSIDGHTYTNSREAFLRSYSLGVRCFEVDLAVTQDNQLVCVHSETSDKLKLPSPEQSVLSELCKQKTLEKYSNEVHADS